MRISTNTLYTAGTTRMSELETSMFKVQQQMSLGKRILTPSDDPIAAAQILELNQSQSMNAQYSVNRQNAKNSLGLEENALQNVTTLLQDVKTLVINAGSGILDNTQRKYIASELSGRYDELISLANAKDGAGNYLFSGYSTSIQPYTKSPDGATYNGDQGQRMLQVGPQRQIALSDTGVALFESNRTGNGTFMTGLSDSNKGSGVISSGGVTDLGAVTGHNYEIRFSDTIPNQFDIVDTTASPEIVVAPAARTYASGQAIQFEGIQVDITGVPQNGDTFTIEPSKNLSVFSTINDLINLLNTPVTGDAGKANLTKGLSIANEGIDAALDNVLTVRASVGSRLKELDSLDLQGDDRDLQYSQSLLKLQDLDYMKAITDLSKQKMMLEAAQQAFVKTTSMSLFSYIS